jgi:hypothetical protein
MLELRGEVQTWGLTDNKRHYLMVQMTYGVARKVLKADIYSAKMGKGEQRSIVPAHARHIRQAMESDTFTPTSVSAGVQRRHAQAIRYEEVNGCRYAVLTIQDGDTLPLTDGGHRFEALAHIRQDAEEAGNMAKVAVVDAQPITVMLHLDGDTQGDFINLQLGKPVDPTLLLSLSVNRTTSDPTMKMAFEVGKRLNEDSRSCFYRQVRFDSTGMAALPISTLCSKGASDLGTSLVGLARVGMMGDVPMSAKQLADAVILACLALEKDAPGLLESGQVLTRPPDGTKGAATMLIGLGVALVYRMKASRREVPSPDDLARLVDAARETLGLLVNGNFSGPAKRQLLGRFTEVFFADLTDLDRHDGLPLGLVKLLSASAYRVSPLPSERKQRTQRAA